jgi:acetoin:2,6-dichlorophenolindophenol oxidoreductase subunit alpha
LVGKLINAVSAVGRRAAIADPIEQLRRMIEIRAVEDGLNAQYSAGSIRGSIHTGQGQEAVVVAAAAASRAGDYVGATYRGHGAALAFGMTPLSVIGEVLGRSAGCVGGLGGSMHMADASVRVLPTMAIVGAGLPIAAGVALTAKLRGTGDVSVVFFGDGSTNIGAFHESLNLASVWKLPVVFVCENNLYGEYSPILNTTPSAELAHRAVPYGIEPHVVDGQDLVAMRPVFAEAFAEARDGAGPQFIEAKTYRYHGHSRSDPATYRTQEELDAWKARDPIDLYIRQLVAAGAASEDDVVALTQDTEDQVAVAFEQALSSPPPGRDLLFRHVLAHGSEGV